MPCVLCYLDNSIQLRKQLKPRQACNCPQRYQACGGFFLEIPPRRASLGCASRATTGRQRVSAQWATNALSCPSRQSHEKPAARSRPACSIAMRSACGRHEPKVGHRLTPTSLLKSEPIPLARRAARPQCRRPILVPFPADAGRPHAGGPSTARFRWRPSWPHGAI